MTIAYPTRMTMTVIPEPKPMPIDPGAKPLKPEDCYCGKPAVYKPEGRRGYCSECWREVTQPSSAPTHFPKGG